MLIPHFWAEARVQSKPAGGRSVTVRRWGWSDTSQAEAHALARQRADDALQRILSGASLPRRESRDCYGTQEGAPIREEVVSRHGENVITRNSYGSLCLNTPRVLFADIDAAWFQHQGVPMLGCVVLAVAGIVVGFWQRSALIGMAIGVGAPWLWAAVAASINRIRRPERERRAKRERLASIRAFSAAHPSWHLRVYETPAGYRLLAMHAVFEPDGEAARAALASLDSDLRFARLCALQQCFRARVSPKYWRINYRPARSLPKSKWPFPPEHESRRRAWVDGYEKLAEKFAACRFVERLGDTNTHPEAEAVRALHDALCRADSRLPLA